MSREHKERTAKITDWYKVGDIVYKAGFDRVSRKIKVRKFIIIGGPYLDDPAESHGLRRARRILALSPPFMDVLDVEKNRVYKADMCLNYFTSEESAISSLTFAIE